MKIELTHDILAQKVYEKVSADEKNLRKVERFIHDRYTFYEGNSRKLTRAELNYIQPYFAKVSIDPVERKFIADGMAARQRRLIIAGILLGMVFLGLMAATSTFYSLWANAEVLQMRADSAKNVALEQKLLAEEQSLKAKESAAFAERQRQIAMDQTEEATRQREYAMQSAAIASRNEKLAREAAQKAREAQAAAVVARELAEAAQKNESIEREKADSLRNIALQKARAANLLTAQSLATQSMAIEDDSALRKSLAGLAYRIHECYRTDSLDHEWGNPYDANIYNALYQAHPHRQAPLHGSTGKPDIIRSLLINSNAQAWAGDSYGWIYRFGADKLLQDIPVFANSRFNNSILQMAFSPSENQVAVAGSENEVWIYRSTGTTDRLGFAYAARQKDQPLDTVKAMVFLQEHYLLLAHAQESSLIGLDINLPGQEAKTIQLDLPAPLIHLAYNIGRQLLVGTDKRGRLYCWRLVWQNGEYNFSPIEVVAPENVIYSALAFDPVDGKLAAGSRKGEVYLFRLNEGRLEKYEMLRGHKEYISALAFSQSGSQLATASFDGTVRVWFLANPNYLRYGALVLAENYPLTTGYNQRAYSVAFMPDGQSLLAGYMSGSIKKWPLQAREFYSPDTQTSSSLHEIWERYIGTNKDSDLQLESLCEPKR